MKLIDLTRRSLLVGTGALAATRVFAQSNRAVRIVVPGPAGSAMDALARGMSATDFDGEVPRALAAGADEISARIASTLPSARAA